MSVIQDRVHKGALWLDAVYRDWFKHINISCLSVQYDTTCVVGQITGSYNAWVEKNKVNEMKQINVGLYLSGKHYKHKNYRKLTEAWKKEVACRLGV